MSDETPLQTWRAARPMGRGLAKGTLQLTRTHVVFEPKGLAKRIDGIRFSVALKHIAAVGTVPGSGSAFSGGKLDRLCITLSDGSQWEFVVTGLGEAVAAIGAKVG